MNGGLTTLVLAVAQARGADWTALLEAARLAAADGFVADAERLLTEAVGTEDGRIDPEAWYLLARARVALADLDGARHAADRAHVYARDPDQAEQTAALSAWLVESFGILALSPPRGKAVAVALAPVEAPYDPALIAWTEAALARMAAPIDRPIRVGLPAGAWRAGGTEVQLAPGAVVDLRVGRREDPWADVQVSAGGTVSGWSSEAPDLPAPAFSVTADLPVGPLRFGVEASAGPAPWRLASGATVSSPRVEGGPRVVLRPWPDSGVIADLAVSLRVGNVPGIPRGCSVVDGSGWVCGAGPDDGLVAYPSAWAWTPGADLELGWLHPRAPSAVGVVGGLGAGASFGRLPAAATADRVDGGGSVPYVLNDRSWRAVALRGRLALVVRI
jgi:hypothetical protein